MRLVHHLSIAAVLMLAAGSPVFSQSTPQTTRATDAAVARLDRARERIAQINHEIRSATGRFDLSGEGIYKAIDRLQQQQEQLELDEAGALGRQNAIENAVARYSEEAKKRLQDGDPVVDELEKVVATREKQFERMQSLFKSGATSVESLDAAEAAVAQAKADVAAARNHAAGMSGIAEALNAWNREAMNLSIERAERTARLKYIKQKIDALRTGAGKLDERDAAIEEETAAANDLARLKGVWSVRPNEQPAPPPP